jgi:hypothetical protein
MFLVNQTLLDRVFGFNQGSGDDIILPGRGFHRRQDRLCEPEIQAVRLRAVVNTRRPESSANGAFYFFD